MRYLKLVYVILADGDFTYVRSNQQFDKFIALVDLQDEQFTTEMFPPGTSGESKLFKLLNASLDELDKDQLNLLGGDLDSNRAAFTRCNYCCNSLQTLLSRYTWGRTCGANHLKPCRKDSLHPPDKVFDFAGYPNAGVWV